MMIISLLLSAAASVAAPQPVATPDRLFLNSCFAQNAALVGGEGAPVAFKALPRELRVKLGSPKSSEVWQVQGAPDTFFYKLQFARGDLSPRVCGVASKRVSFRGASETVAAYFNETLDMDAETVTKQWWDPDAGFMALTSRVGDFTVLQLNWLSEGQIREARDGQ